jgi:hypothetical protein
LIVVAFDFLLYIYTHKIQKFRAMNIKRILFSTFLIISFAQISFGQDKEVVTNEDKAKHETTQLAEKLKLSNDQQEQIYYINLGIIQKNEAVLADKTLTKEQQAEYLKGNDDAKKEMIKSVLTPEQRAIFENTKQSGSMRNNQGTTPVKKMDTKPQMIQLKMN